MAGRDNRPYISGGRNEIPGIPFLYCYFVFISLVLPGLDIIAGDGVGMKRFYSGLDIRRQVLSQVIIIYLS
jgi:hypothetical protein